MERHISDLEAKLAESNERNLLYIADMMQAEDWAEVLETQLAEAQGDGITAEAQNRILELCQRGITDETIDGSGCDSGDPVDLTLAEVGQARQ